MFQTQLRRDESRLSSFSRALRAHDDDMGLLHVSSPILQRLSYKSFVVSHHELRFQLSHRIDRDADDDQ